MEKNDVISWIIKNESDEILVLDKWSYTILPWWKRDLVSSEKYEEDTVALRREIQEELWIDWEVWALLLETTWVTPNSKKNRKIRVYQFIISQWISDIVAQNEVKDARFLSPQEIISLKSTSDITRDIVKRIMNLQK